MMIFGFAIERYMLIFFTLFVYLEYLYGLVEAMGLVIERDVANWIANQGGWVSVYILIRGHGGQQE